MVTRGTGAISVTTLLKLNIIFRTFLPLEPSTTLGRHATSTSFQTPRPTYASIHQQHSHYQSEHADQNRKYQLQWLERGDVGSWWKGVRCRSKCWMIYRIDPSSNALRIVLPVELSHSDCLRCQWNDRTLASGGWMQDTPQLFRFNPTTMTVEATFDFSSVDENPEI